MDNNASYGEVEGASCFGLDTPMGGDLARKTRAVGRGSKWMREETEADEIHVREPMVFDGTSKISNTEHPMAITDEFSKSRAE